MYIYINTYIWQGALRYPLSISLFKASPPSFTRQYVRKGLTNSKTQARVFPINSKKLNNVKRGISNIGS
jgi:hypothetical protein